MFCPCAAVPAGSEAGAPRHRHQLQVHGYSQFLHPGELSQLTDWSLARFVAGTVPAADVIRVRLCVQQCPGRGRRIRVKLLLDESYDTDNCRTCSRGLPLKPPSYRVTPRSRPSPAEKSRCASSATIFEASGTGSQHAIAHNFGLCLMCRWREQPEIAQSSQLSSQKKRTRPFCETH